MDSGSLLSGTEDQVTTWLHQRSSVFQRLRQYHVSSYIKVRLRRIHTVLSDDTAKSINCSNVMSKLDYCNSLLYGMPKITTDKLQHPQNVLAHVVTQSENHLRAKPIFQQLHYLPAEKCISYEVTFLAYKVQTILAPDYTRFKVVFTMQGAIQVLGFTFTCSHTTTSDC